MGETLENYYELKETWQADTSYQWSDPSQIEEG